MTLIKDIINQNKRLAKISKVISELSDETQINAFLVGGCVRDLMLNPLAESIDVDIMVEGDGISFAKLLAKKDFTINAMAVSLNKENFGEFFDPFNGMEDLSKNILRTPLDSDTTFSDDPLRMMRAAYFASKLSLDLDPSCLESIKNNSERITIVSQERKTNELLKHFLWARALPSFC